MSVRWPLAVAVALLVWWRGILFVVSRFPKWLICDLGDIGYLRHIGQVGPLRSWAVCAPALLCLACFLASFVIGGTCGKYLLRTSVYFAVGAVVVVVVSLPPIAGGRISYRASSCVNNLKQLGIVFKMYLHESQSEFFPSLSSEPGRLMMQPEALYPEYLTDPGILLCVDHNEDNFLWWEANRDAPAATWFDDQSYYYLGYAIANDGEIRAFADAYRQRISQGLAFDADLPVAAGCGSRGGDALLRLRAPSVESAERHERNEPPRHLDPRASETALLIERLGNHETPGGNVLFLDGHREFVSYPGKWPMTEATMSTLAELDGLGPPVSAVRANGAAFSFADWTPRMWRAFVPFLVIGLVLGLVVVLIPSLMRRSSGSQA